MLTAFLSPAKKQPARELAEGSDHHSTTSALGGELPDLIAGENWEQPADSEQAAAELASDAIVRCHSSANG